MTGRYPGVAGSNEREAPKCVATRSVSVLNVPLGPPNMKPEFDRIWSLAVPYLKAGKKKDFLTHTEGVVRAMRLLLKREGGDENILIPAAMLHDTGWSRVPLELQKSREDEKARKAMELHLTCAAPIIREVLTKIGYDKNSITKIVGIVLAHKFSNPKAVDKRLLIDADTLSDAFKAQFYSDCKEYGLRPEKLYEIRKEKDKFYTKSAKAIFSRELEQRRKEFSNR